jgi:glycosyltransferase involved in cell wall biosynthesis
LPIILKSADKIIVSSLDYIENSNIRDFYLSHQNKFASLPFGVGENFAPSEKNFSLLKKMNFSDEDSVVGFVGTLDSEHYFKGINFLITALSKIANPHIKLVIVGDGNLRKQYEHWAKKLGVKDRITFTGFIPHELLPEYYNLFDIFVLPSIDRAESFGLVLLEAMACGKPLIASNLKGVREVAIAGKSALLIEPGNPKDITDKILYLLEDRGLYNHFRDGGLKLIAERYRWGGIVKKLIDIYNGH